MSRSGQRENGNAWRRTERSGGKRALWWLAGAAIATAAGTRAQAAETCLPASSQAPMLVTADCKDPVYNAANFAIDSVTQAASPSPHTKVVGHFKATDTTPQFTVAFYLPLAASWQGRFFQHAYPLEQPENRDDLAFALANGGYLVNVKGVPCGCGGYRPDAAAAKLAKDYARRFYQTSRRIYGYLWGGSGGGLLSAGAAENTQGVWDGVVPYVLPNAASLANVNASSALTGLALRDKLAAISDAVAPGSAHDPFATLNAQERAILTEALTLGMPLSTLENAEALSGVNPLLILLTGGVKANDPTYAADFWSKPGYEGADPPAYLAAALRQEWATVTEVERDARGAVTNITLDRAPPAGAGPLAPITFEYWLYDPNGRTKLGELGGRLDGETIRMQQQGPGATGQLGQGVEALVTRASLGAADRVAPGQKVSVNNRNYLALHYYHRHAMPRDRDMYPYDQFRNADGTPRYPQRAYLASPESAAMTAGGGTQTGRIRTKVIILQSLVDGGAQPWMADWYARRVRAALGAERYADNFRVFFNDNAGHLDIEPRGPMVANTIDYVPSLYQSLLDLSAWAERGVAPPLSTRYTVADGQVHLRATAGERHGLQPVVDLTVNGAKRIEVGVGQMVRFTGRVTAAPNTGNVTTTAWWFGEGQPTLTPSPLARPAPSVEATGTHTYAVPGTYFVTLRATVQREGRAEGGRTQVQNLDRVRVVVR